MKPDDSHRAADYLADWRALDLEHGVDFYMAGTRLDTLKHALLLVRRDRLIGIDGPPPRDRTPLALP